MLDRIAVLRPLAVPDMRRLWLATGLSLIGDGAYFVAIAWVALEVSASPQTLALIVLAWTIGMVLALPIAGVTADRRRRRDVLIGADVARAIVLGGMGAVALADHPAVAALVVLSALHGAAEAFFTPAFTAMIPQLVERDDVVAANALEQVLRPIAYRLIGPAVGALFVAVVDPSAALLLDAATFVASAVLLARITPLAPPQTATQHGRADRVRAGFAFVRTQRWLLALMAASAVSTLCIWGPLETLVPFTIREHLSAGAWQYAALLVCSGAGGMIGGLVLGHFPEPKRPTLAIAACWAASGASLGAYALCSAAWQMWPFGLVFGFGLAYGGALYTSLLQRTVPTHLLGRVGALDEVITFGLTPVSLAIVGPLSDAFDPLLVLGLAGVVTAAAVLSTLLVGDVRRVRAPDLAAAAA